MTPQLQQAIKLLQLSNLELSTYLEQELERNPLLQRADGEATATGAPAPEERAPAGGEPPPAFADWGGGGGGGGLRYDDDDSAFEQRAARAEAPSLREHLMEQVRLTFAEPLDLAIAEQLVDMLDESGYLKGELGALAVQLGCAVAQVEDVLARVQGFDPAGVFARSLAECLALQLAERDRLDPAMRPLLEPLDLVARRDLPRLRRLCGVDAEDLADMMAEIRALDPKPALAFSGEPVRPVIPDILMRPRQGGGYALELNPQTLPRVLVDRRYYAEVLERSRDAEARRYLSDRLQSANWLAKALDQRAQTILKVASEIVRRQADFFAQGATHLKPLTLREVADSVEMHESTISRVTANKFMVTPRGTFELKYFFTAAISGSDGENHSAEAVRQRIRQLIDAETVDNVLSDDAVVAILRDDGIDIARRTVAKYREAMHIPSSVQRRREKVAGC